MHFFHSESASKTLPIWLALYPIYNMCENKIEFFSGVRCLLTIRLFEKLSKSYDWMEKICPTKKTTYILDIQIGHNYDQERIWMAWGYLPF